MQPRLYKKILKLIETNHLQTITVDIFDTILLNDYWPEDLRYYDLAKRWATELYRLTTIHVTSYELFSLHQQAKRELRQAGRPMQIDVLLDTVLDLLCAKYAPGLNFTSDERLQILATMIATEIQFHISMTRPNHNLIAQLDSIKQAHPEVKIYFVTDTPFFATQIKTMLQILDIKIFDGGIASSDYGAEKRTGQIYELISQEFHDFDLMRNLHLGDCRWSDYIMPIARDSMAIHYRPMRMRGLRTIVGNCAMRIIDLQARYHETARFAAAYPQNLTVSESWEEYGAILAQYQAIWNTQVNLRAELTEDTTYLLTRKVAEFCTPRPEQINLLSSTLDRETILRAFIWLLATFETTRWNAAKLLELLVQVAGIKQRKDLYALCFGKKYALSDFAIQSLSDAEFYTVFLTEVKSADEETVQTLHESYEQMAQLLPRDEKNLCIIEQNDDGTAMLFREFTRLHGVTNEISEWILDAEGNVTRAEKLVAGKINSRRQDRINHGRQNGPALLRQTELNADEYIKTILKPRLQKVLKDLV